MLLCSADTHVPAIEYRLLEYRYKVLHSMIYYIYTRYNNCKYINIYAPSSGIPVPTVPSTGTSTKVGNSIHDAPVPLFVRMDESRNLNLHAEDN